MTIAATGQNAEGFADARRGLLLGLVAVALFSLTLPATRAAVSHFSPWFVASGRAVVAALLALAVLAVVRPPLPTGAQWKQLGVIALGVVFGFPFFTTWAMQHVPAAHGAVVLALLPLMTALAGAWVAHERPGALFWSLAVLGSILAVAYALRQGGGGFHAADAALLAAIVAAALGYALGAETSRSLGGWQTISWALVLSLPVNVVIAALTWPTNVHGAATTVWAGFAYVSLISMYLGFFPWYRALAIGGIARVGQIQLLQPFMTFAASALWLGEVIDRETLLFAVAIAIIVGLGRRAPIRMQHR
ncbi:MAG: DMT family transporter [Burkholderiales bacterium]|nr:DMT family transporter [Burkholderiales bacterium]